MFRFLVFLLIVLCLGLLFAWVAENPGTIFLQWEWLATKLGHPGEDVGIPLTAAIIALLILVTVIMFVASLLRGIFGMPSFLSRFFDNRRRERGYKALSQGLIAASSGDVDMARSFAKDSGRLLKNEPLVALLGTQTALLEGKREVALENFKTMLEDDSTRMVALRGLFLEAERQGETEAARHYAEEAVRQAPALPWAGNAKLRYQAGDNDWDDALRTLEANRSAGLIDKGVAKRQRAVLLTAKAISKEQASPEEARKYAKEAHKLDKGFVPAATTYARSASRMGDIKGASKIIEACWKVEPHPELAEAYATVRPGDSVQDRLTRARKLAKIKTSHPEGNIAVAMAAIDASEWEEARTALEPVLTMNITERSCLLMADIEEGQHGDKGRMRDWLSRAVRSPADAAWVADNHVSEEWLPISPITGEIDAFEWKVPVEQLGDTNSAPALTVEQLQEEAKPVVPAAPIVEEAKPEEEQAEVIEEAEVVEEVPVLKTEETKPAAEPVEEKVETAKEEVSEDVTVVTLDDDDDAKSGAEEKADAPEDAEAPSNDNDEKPEETVDESVETKDEQSTKDDGDEDNTVEFPLKRRPDDPGVHPDKEKGKKGFSIFS